MGYTLFLDIAILPERDIVFISDFKFQLRPIRNALLETPKFDLLQHVSLTANVWYMEHKVQRSAPDSLILCVTRQELRLMHHDFPHAIAASPAGILGKMTALRHFYLALNEGDLAEIDETASYGFEGEWTEEYDHRLDESDQEDGDLEGDLDSDERAELSHRRQVRADKHEESLTTLNNIHSLPPIQTDENGEATPAGNADRYLRSLEARVYAQLVVNRIDRSTGILQLASIYRHSIMAEAAPDFKTEVKSIFRKEMAANPEWKAPAIHIRELEAGIMYRGPHEDDHTDHWEDSSEEEDNGDWDSDELSNPFGEYDSDDYGFP